MRHLLLAFSLIAAPAHAQPPAPSARPIVRTAADLPQTRYAVPEPPSRYVFTDGFVRDLVPRLRADAERALAGNDFSEASLRRQLASGLAAIALIQNRPADAEHIILAQRALETLRGRGAGRPGRGALRRRRPPPHRAARRRQSGRGARGSRQPLEPVPAHLAGL
jgi:hypothetical protein